MKGRYLVTKFFCKIEHDRHFVAAIAVVVYQDLAIEHTHQGIELNITLGFLLAQTVSIVIPTGFVFAGLDPGLAIAGHITHA